MIYYEVTRQDLMKASTFKWWIVTQPIHNAPHWREIQAEFYRFIRGMKDQVLYKRITIEEANIEIRKEVLRLTAKYPKDFPKANELGEYSKKILAEKFIAGEITLNNSYDVNVMLSERVALLKAIADDAELVALNKKRAEEAEREASELAEKSRIPVEIGMLFKTKEAMARAFKHQYPKDTKMSFIVKEIPNAMEVEHGKHKYNKYSWLVKEVYIEGGLAYLEDTIA